MHCKGRFVKIFTILILGIVALNISQGGMNGAVNAGKHETIQYEGFVTELPPPGELASVSSLNRSAAPLDRVFQLIFILFFVSPPLIVILLFLIWRELKKRNRLK
jgi:hypothetical protein